MCDKHYLISMISASLGLRSPITLLSSDRTDCLSFREGGCAV